MPKWSPEQKKKHSEAMQRAWKDPDIRERMSSAIRAKLAQPEVRARMKAGHARRKAIKEAAKADQAVVAILGAVSPDEVVPPEKVE